MKLTQKALDAINNRAVILAIALGLDFSELWVNKLIEANKENSALTTAKALLIIKKETGLTDEDILEAEQINLYPQK
ncbi:MAG TPA: hypothetical protein VMZ03_03990 [Chitinophagaceae bacterium]|nr:hypothetical protein [Chitinophagaceae bacterium]